MSSVPPSLPDAAACARACEGGGAWVRLEALRGVLGLFIQVALARAVLAEQWQRVRRVDDQRCLHLQQGDHPLLPAIMDIIAGLRALDIHVHWLNASDGILALVAGLQCSEQCKYCTSLADDKTSHVSHVIVMQRKQQAAMLLIALAELFAISTVLSTSKL